MVPSEEMLGNLRRGALSFCILGALEGSEGYAYELTKLLSDAGPLIGGQGTMYPLLSRLRQSGWVSTTWRESNSGPPRRYYQLTAEGASALDSFRAIWPGFVGAVDRFTGKGN